MLKYNKIKNTCTGCFACYNICPTNAISMRLNKEGFLYPEIDKEKCINCGLCEKVCPVLNKIKNNNLKPKIVFAAKSKNQLIQKNSSSGGIFSELANYILDRKGVVFGVTFKNNKTKHICIKNKDELEKIRGSKYLQSYINYSFKDVEKNLVDKKDVLFSGTPCQISGLKEYLKLRKTDDQNLFLIDVVCHGVPSYKIFKEYLKNEFGGNTRIKNINFRYKKESWDNYYITYYFDKGKEISNNYKRDYFFRGYLKNFYLRKSCYNCNLARIPRQGDITLGDFWGIKKEYYDSQGISLILINNKKGKNLINKIIKLIEIEELDIIEASKGNPRLINGKYDSIKEREQFFIDYFANGFVFVKKKYLKSKTTQLIILKIKKLLGY
ncbi:MAG: F(420)H(2) dehydrogenase subunit F [archaeon ADurb.Bin336]|nr:MAG: F(420)H(2) dehydrogenase subunit F [archaeon ADurb.Bin336]